MAPIGPAAIPIEAPEAAPLRAPPAISAPEPSSPKADIEDPTTLPIPATPPIVLVSAPILLALIC